MGLRGEIFSTRVQLQNRTYFFNVKENRLGDIYLNLVESKNKDEGGFERQSVVLFADDLAEFLSGFDEALKVMDKADREKKRSARPVFQNARPGQSGEGGKFPPRKKRVVVQRERNPDSEGGGGWHNGESRKPRKVKPVSKRRNKD